MISKNICDLYLLGHLRVSHLLYRYIFPFPSLGIIYNDIYLIFVHQTKILALICERLPKHDARL